MIQVHGFVARSKKTGYYFRFEKMYDDGWGVFYDDIFEPDCDDMPHIFPDSYYDSNTQHKRVYIDRNFKNLQYLTKCNFYNHDYSEIELVPIVYTIG
jgi:hypothetical protein